MKTRINLITLLLLFGGMAVAQQTNTEFPKLSGSYLGQTPPGKTPIPFAPEFFGSRFYAFHSTIVFSPDGNEAYWQGRLNNGSGSIMGIWESKIVNGFWSEPKPASFSICDKRGLDDSPFITADGKKLFFLSYRPINKEGEPEQKCNVWFVERQGNDWSEPKHLPLILQSPDEDIHWRISLDYLDNLYFGAWYEKNNKYFGDIYISKYENGRYENPEKLDAIINKKDDYNFAPSISVDGSYLLFCRTPNITYCSFKNKEGKWTEAIKLDTKNFAGLDVPVLSTDSKYLFLRGFDDSKKLWRLLWVDAKIIEELKPKGLK